MQVLLMVLVLGIFIHDALVAPETIAPSSILMLTAVLLPKVLWVIAYTLTCRWAYRHLDGTLGPSRVLSRLDRFTTIFRLGVAGLYLVDLCLGALVYIRTPTRHPVLIDEVAIISPTLVLFCLGLLVYYPIERRLREASLIHRFDQGLPVYPIKGRWSYVITHLRHEAALILIPLLLVMAWVEVVPDSWLVWKLDLAPILIFVGAAVIFLFAPMIIRYIWDTKPLPDGAIRQRLMAMCHTYRVQVRDVLLWQTTSGGMINAAVMGLIRPLRYILLSDGLLDQLPQKQVEAVMAHELAHVCRRHMFWLLAVALTTLGLTMLLVFAVVYFGSPDGVPNPAATGFVVIGATEQKARSVLAIGGALAIWAVVFGWVSRRVERQADTFAVQHLTRQRNLGTIDAEAVQTMVGALQQVADLNHMHTGRRNWRHGSITWRQNHLRTLVGQLVERPAIDHLMNRIKLVTLAGMVVLGATFYF